MDEKELTLNELCRKYGVTRRAVQGYEKHGLTHPTGKTERGYLLYDYAAQMRIVRIKKYQNYGFTVKEIQKLLTRDGDALRVALTEKREKLKAKLRETEIALDEISAEIEKL